MSHQRAFLNQRLPPVLEHVGSVFSGHRATLASSWVRRVPEVVDIVRPDLQAAEWRLSQGQRSTAGIAIPRAPAGRIRAEGYQPHERAVLWVETGRSWTNNAFLAHAIEAAMCPSLMHVAIAVRHTYNDQPAFDRCAEFLEAMFESGRLEMPYESLLLIGF
jgi:hypothetical protein